MYRTPWLMNRLFWLALAAALAFASPAGAQPAKPASAAKSAPKPAAQKPDKKQSAASHKSRRHEDARACLERASNSEIIKCAEAYL